jgi:hypothetical protein
LLLNTLIIIASSQLDLLRDRLERLRKCIAEKHPHKIDLVPSPDSIDIEKLGGGGVVMTDTCNTAQKLRRILVEVSDDILDLDCMNHLCNVWIGNIEKALSKYLNDLLRNRSKTAGCCVYQRSHSCSRQGIQSFGKLSKGSW